ncbi:fungal-specific transcription factor domain-containing protein [Penicillium cataractarum]|uniref:Fungal-specific transcription factor domain-containing protein n=1 Tax=Penicillium cataractarum TaxID=2100454 RepID=A0A9W9VWW1_9EURO|nr:fungal-specific transcription factor domain-containing protein [Penicillium cataractarum]KAJ5390700.1 fungal-specific transcription factor domain-containing protein [Penicillium cataractarum]
MVALNLFHEPTFTEKLSKISSLWELTALLAAMAAFASRFFDHTSDTSTSDGDGSQIPQTIHQPAYFLDHAFNYINKAVTECEDEVPPLCVIQALIIATHCQLTRGVRGKAWRSLGLCASLVYEANLHVLDSEAIATPDPQQWQLEEEKRRAFWAIWEMDVFASTIRRTPTAINWNQMAVLLPADNANWFSGNPTSSCFMETDPNQRWKTLQESGNQSAKAWFLVINSLMKTAQTTANPRGIAEACKSGHSWLGHRVSTPKSIRDTRQNLETLANAVRCFSLALPDRLLYRDQYLAFDAPVHRKVESQRQRDCDIYNIFVMMQLARLMIYRYDAFSPQSRRSEINGRDGARDSASRAASNDTENVALQQYYDAADRILKIVRQSCEEHIKHINPFLSSTIWLAAAVQLVRKHFTRPSSNTSLIKSRFDVLYLTYKRCTLFWDTQTALQRNLESLEEQLEARQRLPHIRSRQHSPNATKRTVGELEANSQSSEQQGDQAKRHKKTQGAHTPLSSTQQSRAADLPTTANSNDVSTQYLPESPISPVDFPLLAHERMHISADNYIRQPFTALESTEIMDPMTLAQPGRDNITETYMMPANSDFLDSMDLGNTYDDQALEWERLDFPARIHDIFAGWTSY